MASYSSLGTPVPQKAADQKAITNEGFPATATAPAIAHFNCPEARALGWVCIFFFLLSGGALKYEPLFGIWFHGIEWVGQDSRIRVHGKGHWFRGLSWRFFFFGAGRPFPPACRQNAFAARQTPWVMEVQGAYNSPWTPSIPWLPPLRSV